MSNGYFLVLEMKNGSIQTMGNSYEQDHTPLQFINDVLKVVDVDDIKRFVSLVMDEKDGKRIQQVISVKPFNERIKTKTKVFDLEKMLEQEMIGLKELLIEQKSIPLMVLGYRLETETYFLIPHGRLFDGEKKESSDLRISVLETLIDCAQEVIKKEKEESIK